MTPLPASLASNAGDSLGDEPLCGCCDGAWLFRRCAATLGRVGIGEEDSADVASEVGTEK